MKIRNNIYLLVSLIVSTAILIVLLFADNSGNNTSIDKNLFKVKDQTGINKVELHSGNEKIKLEYNGIKWMVNDSLEADRQLIKVFFATLLQSEPKRPVAKRLEDSVKHRLSVNGTTVNLFADDELVKSYSVAGNNRKTETYYLLAGDNTPYVVSIPGYRVYVAGIFELTSQEWREKRIFNFNWQNFKRLTTTYPSSPVNNFSVSFQNGFFGLEESSKADTTMLNDYLDAVSLLQASRFIRKAESPALDSLFKKTPDFTVSVSDIANRTYRLDVYNIPVNDAYLPARFNGWDELLLDMKEAQRIIRKKRDFIR